jgi:hypothetical protein
LTLTTQSATPSTQPTKMRLYYIVSGILLILPIIDFAAAAPVPVKKGLHARVDVVHIPMDAMMKRGGELDKVFFDIFGDTEDHFVRPDSPEESIATRPSSSSQPSRLADGSMAVENPLLSISKELPQVSGPDRAQPSAAFETLGHPESAKSEELPATHPPSSLPPPEPADGPMHVKQPLAPPSIHEEQSPEDDVSPNRGDKLNDLWLELFGHSEDHLFKIPEGSSVARPPSPSSSPPSEPADGSMDVEQPLPSVHEESLPASGQDDVSPNRDDKLNDLWLELFGHSEDHSFTKPEGSSAARPSSSSPQSGSANGRTDVMPLPSILKETSPVSSPDHVPPSRGDELNRQLDVRHRARRSQGPTIGGRTSCNCYRLSSKRRRQCRARAGDHRDQNR